MKEIIKVILGKVDFWEEGSKLLLAFLEPYSLSSPPAFITVEKTLNPQNSFPLVIYWKIYTDSSELFCL